MEKKFFMRRFRNYFLLLIIPTFLVFMISFLVVNAQIDKELDGRARNTLSNLDTNLDFVISSVVFQNDQLTNNSYMVLALKKLLKRDTNIQYSEAIYLRNIKTMLSSIVQSYPYIESVYLYLDGYDNFFSSKDGVVNVLKGGDITWLESCHQMDRGVENYVQTREIRVNDKTKKAITIYQRMLLLDGIVVMNINVEKYQKLLDKILMDDEEIVVFFDKDGTPLFSWNDKGDEALQQFTLTEHQADKKQNKWIEIGGQRYLFHTTFNNEYRMNLVSLIPFHAKISRIQQMIKLFGIIFLINSVAMMALAYFTTRKTFRQLYYMIQVFHDAEVGIYPMEPRTKMRDEYDVIMNNIIYLFLQTMKLNGSLVQRQHDQEVAELTALQLQINPHFLFNTLQNVQMEIQKLDRDTGHVKKILDDLSDILKYALADPLEKITLEEEIQYLKKYIAIQHYRFGERFIPYYEIEDGLRDIRVFRLMLQPLVENSILHGIRQKEGTGYIKIQIFRRDGLVFFRVVDNGIGMTKQERDRLRESMKTMNVHHIGLANVNSRLKLHYGEQAEIRIRAKSGVGCSMEFVIPDERPVQEKNKNIKN